MRRIQRHSFGPRAMKWTAIRDSDFRKLMAVARAAEAGVNDSWRTYVLRSAVRRAVDRLNAKPRVVEK